MSSVTERLENLGHQAAEQDFGKRVSRASQPPTFLNQVERYCYQHPVKTILMGVGAGMLISALFVRR